MAAGLYHWGESHPGRGWDRGARDRRCRGVGFIEGCGRSGSSGGGVHICDGRVGKPRTLQYLVLSGVAEEVAAEEGAEVCGGDMALLRLGQLPDRRSTLTVCALPGMSFHRRGVVEGRDLTALGRPLRVEVVVVRAADRELVEAAPVPLGRVGRERERLTADLSVACSPEDGEGGSSRSRSSTCPPSSRCRRAPALPPP